MWPKHKNPTYYRNERNGDSTRRRAVAPYNFVPLPDAVRAVDAKCVPGHDRYEEGTYTGSIECTLKTETPLYTRSAMDIGLFDRYGDDIRELMKDDDARRRYARFFHLGDAEKPVIPASSLRGMVRSVVEIISASKMQWVTDSSQVFRAVGDPTSLGEFYRKQMMEEDSKDHFTPLMRAGYLEVHNGRWSIRPATKSSDGVTFARIKRTALYGVTGAPWHKCQRARTFWVKTGAYAYQDVRQFKIRYKPAYEPSDKPTRGHQQVVLAESGRMNGKKHEAVFFLPDPKASLIPIREELLARYRDQISPEQRKLLGDNGALVHMHPVFYLMRKNELGEEELVFFGHPMMFRLPYEKSPLDLVPAALRDPNMTDLAEAMFGHVPESDKDRRDARAGRVYFGDGVLAPNQTDVWLSQNPITPKILSGPKPTTFQHYLTQQEPDDIFVKEKKNGQPQLRTDLDHYASPPSHETVIRGHKLYWHKSGTDAVDRDFIMESDPVANWGEDSQHTQIRPVAAGKEFRFTIRFENLTDVELGALLWALRLPPAGGTGYRHKLGMGKPLGMGTVEVAVKKVQVDVRQERYKTLFNENGSWHQPMADGNLADFEGAFEAFMLIGSDYQRLHELPRMYMLLRMLTWPGPAHQHTRYMNLNEFGLRPVLPGPLAIEESLREGYQPTATTSVMGGDQATPVRAPIQWEHEQTEEGKALTESVKRKIAESSKVETAAPPSEVEPYTPTSLNEIKEGDYITATVRGGQFNVVELEAGTTGVTGKLAETNMAEGITREYFTEGMEVPLWVRDVHHKKKRINFTMKRP